MKQNNLQKYVVFLMVGTCQHTHALTHGVSMLSNFDMLQIMTFPTKTSIFVDLMEPACPEYNCMLQMKIITSNLENYVTIISLHF